MYSGNTKYFDTLYDQDIQVNIGSAGGNYYITHIALLWKFNSLTATSGYNIYNIRDNGSYYPESGQLSFLGKNITFRLDNIQIKYEKYFLSVEFLFKNEKTNDEFIYNFNYLCIFG